jgi:hypothetical protein
MSSLLLRASGWWRESRANELINVVCERSALSMGIRKDSEGPSLSNLVNLVNLVNLSPI